MSVDVEVGSAGNNYSIGLGGTQAAGDPETVLDAAHSIVREILLRELGSGLLLHAASFRANDRNIVMFADKGAGKTTLALKCLASGIQVYGDEHVLVSGTRIRTRPRTLRVKEASVAVVPELAELIQGSPAFINYDGSRIYSVVPATGSINWELSPYSVDYFIHLTPNHGGASDFRKLSKENAYQVAMQQSFLPDHSKGTALAALHSAISGAQCWHLNVGDLDQAVDFLKDLP